MKRRITFLTAAFALLAFLVIPIGMWGQSDYSTDYTGNITLSTTGGSNASVCSIIISDITYSGIKAGTSGKTGAVMITVPAGTKYLHIHVAAWNNTTASLAVTPEGYSEEIPLTANSGILNNSPFTFSSNPSTSDYYKVITFSSALTAETNLTFTAVGGKRFVIWGVTSEEEGVAPAIATPTFSPASGTTFGDEGLSVTISCATDGVDIYYTTDGSEPDDESTPYSGSITLTTTTTIKAIAYDINDNTGNVGTATYTYIDPNAPGSQNNPYTVAQARDAIDAGTGITGVYATGIVSGIVSAYDTQYNNISFNFSDDGETTSDQLEAFRCAGNEAADVTVGDIVVVYGNLTLYNNTTYEFAQGCQLVSLTHPGTFVATPTFSPEGGIYTEIQTVSISCATDGVDLYYTLDGTDPDDESLPYNGPITISETTTIKAVAYDSNDHMSAIATATYTLHLPVPEQTFSKIEGHNPVEGQTYLIVDLNTNRALTSANGSSSAPAAVEVTITEDQITTNNADLQWTFEAVEDGYIIHPIESNDTWLYTTSSSNNGVRVGDNEANVWTLDITDESTYHGFMNNTTSRYLGVYNSQDWRAYTTIHANIKDTQIALFVLGDAPAPSPSITIENNDEIAFNATSGSFNYIVNNPADDGQMTVSENEDWISDAQVSVTPAGNVVTFTTTVNEDGSARHGVITLTYTYNRATITKNVTVTQEGNPDIFMTIAEVREQGTGDVVTKGIVTSCVGTTGYIQDANAAICVYGVELTVGDEIKVSGTLSTYNGLLEIGSNNNIPTVEVLSQNNTINPQLMTIAEINASTNQGWYIRIENATVTAISGQNTTIAQDENTIVVRGISSELTYQIGDILSLNGNIGNYNGVQIANPQNVEVQVSLDPIITVVPERVDVSCAEAEGTLTVNYQNIETEVGVSIYWYEADGVTPATYDWIIANVDNELNVEYLIEANTDEARTAYMKVCGMDAETNLVYSNLVTFSQGHYVPDYAELPFSFDGGKADIDNINGLTADGLGSDYNNSPKLKFDGTGDWLLLHFIEEPGTLSFSIKGNSFSQGSTSTFTVQTSNDGETYTDLAVYTELGAVDTVEFNLDADVRYVKWIYTEKGSTNGGNVALGNIVLDLPSTTPVISLTPATVEVTAAETVGTLTMNYVNMGDEPLFEVQFFAEDGETPAEYDWILAEVNAEMNVDYMIAVNEGEARTAYLKVYGLTDEADEVYSNLVTITQAAYVPPFAEVTYSLASYIESGRHYIITNGADKAMGAQGGNNRPAATITISEGVATVNTADVYEVVINGPDVNGYYTIYDAREAGYLYAASSGSNYLRTREFNTDANSQWTITFGEENNAVITAQGNNTRNLMRYNSGSDLFACYTGGQQPVYLYVKNNETNYEFYKDIAGYGQNSDKWCLMASPVNNMNPANVSNLLENDFDFYMFDQSSSEEEWQNVKTDVPALTSGTGYLYANNTDIILKFEGTPYNSNGVVALTYDANANPAGWNLVGNPFGYVAYVDGPFYIMNDEGTDIVLSERNNVNPMEGIFVKATAEGETIIFYNNEVENTGPVVSGDDGIEGKLNLCISDANGIVDIASIHFGEGSGLEKLQLNPKHTKLYFTQDNTDYAVVCSAKQGEMPVNFKPETNGTYTFSVNAESMEYLHLIDNLTGADIDLLQTSSYSFEASVSDNAARFTLVFIGK